MNTEITVIIPTMNRPNSLSQTLEYISKGTCKPSQVIIVDQSQTEILQNRNKGLVDAYSKVLPNIEYHYQIEPSLTKARNFGFSFARNEVIVFSDDDVDVRKDTYENISYLFSDPSVAMVGGVQDGEKKSPPSTMSHMFGMASFKKRRIGHMARACYGVFPSSVGDLTPTEWAMGFFFAVRKSLMEKYHLCFDENLKSYAYAEDLDFTYGYYLRANAEKLKCFMSRKLVVRHNASKEYRIPQRKHTFMLVLHRYYISNKYQLPLYELNILWNSIGWYFFRLLKRETPKDLLDAQMFYFKHRCDVLHGCFHSDEWQN